jgi:radical SAM superfamily enzyme YgiQ (UPF0313 family)
VFYQPQKGSAMRVILSTLPREGSYKSWITPGTLEPRTVKYLPLGLLSLATNVTHLGHEIEILDPFSNGWSINDTAEQINQEHPDIVGFSAATRWSYSLFKLLKKVKAKWKIVGGPHATNHSDELIAWGADAVFVGQLADVEFRTWLSNPIRGIINCATRIEDIAFPDRTLVDYKDYFFKGKVLFESSKRMSMFSSVGCPNACRFCSVQSKRVQTKSSWSIVQEMQYLQMLGAQSVHLFDDNFNVNSEHVKAVLREIDKYGISVKWSMRGQVKCDLSLIPEMKCMGLERVHVGIESTDDKVLKWMRKSHRHKDTVAFCDAMNGNGIEVLAYFLIGTPVESERYLDELPKKIRDLGIKMPYFNMLFPEPDTQWGREAGLDPVWKKYFQNPVPDFEIPHPKGEFYKQNIMKTADDLTKEFMK